LDRELGRWGGDHRWVRIGIGIGVRIGIRIGISWCPIRPPQWPDAEANTNPCASMPSVMVSMGSVMSSMPSTSMASASMPALRRMP
jgi:hypothetical protein